MQPSDVYRLRSISDLQIAPDGTWIAYVLSTVDSVKDRSNADLWMVSGDGTQSVPLTNSPDGERQPRFSPDGKYLSFMAKRGDDKNSQVYLLDRRGGEAIRATEIKGEIVEHRWFPDGSALLLTIKQASTADTAASKVRLPHVIDRYHFKEDDEGYRDRRATHLYRFTLATKKLDTLTAGAYDEEQAAVSPDGRLIVFVSNRTADPDRNENSAIYVMEAKPGAPARQLTDWPGTESSPVWSPDGKRIAYLQSSSDEPFTMYGQRLLAAISPDGGTPTILSASLDRPASAPRWSSNSAVATVMADDRQTPLVSFDAANGQNRRLFDGERSISNLQWDAKNGRWLMMISTPQRPSEIFALKGSALTQLTKVHDDFLAPMQLANVTGFQSASSDGAVISSILYRPASVDSGKPLPLVFVIHGGPVGQDDFGFAVTPHVLAGAGYAVAVVNYRGSSGRGIAFTRAIYGDWGILEVRDILGAADHLVKEGVADPDRMGIGGWSYGGISTNYVIASDRRFKAAVSGAGSSLQFSMYGSDQYIKQYDVELGVPWKNAEKWIKVSYPFFQADRITTPTLFMASDDDFNVPVIGAEQMYQALKHTGVPTELVIYPGQHHGLSVPSYIKDRLERHIRWYDRYLKP
jgi:dipeptidyl aminopeptidase/acylaminoacyl peptidase